MTLYGRSSKWASALALGLAGLIGAGAALVLAAPARSAASAFELRLEGTATLTLPPGGWLGITSQGTFTSQAPFCAAGTFTDPDNLYDAVIARRFTCDDGTGSLTLSILGEPLYGPSSWASAWSILDGSGSYAGLRGAGSMRGGLLSGGGPGFPPGLPTTWWSTFAGVVERHVDVVAPTILFTNATATKLRRSAGAYALTLGIALGDDDADNPVSYSLSASVGGVELARRFGTTAGAVSMLLHIRPPAGARTVQLALTGVDPVGNAASVTRSLRLPR